MVIFAESDQARRTVASARQTVVLLISAVALSTSRCAHERISAKELNLIGGYSHRSGWIGQTMALSNSIGFEDYRKFYRQTGDFMTTDLQVRLAYDSDEESDRAWGIEIHNAWLAYRLAYGHTLRAGHFDVPFGLEPVVDTHGTILQTLAMSSVGFKQDWGIGLKGNLTRWDYELALQMGSGMSIHLEDEIFLVSARLGSPSGQNAEYGLSLLCGKVLESMDMRTFPRSHLLSEKPISKKMIGLDGQYLFGPVLFKGEAVYGGQQDNQAFGCLLEADLTIPDHQECEIGFQFQSWINDMKHVDHVPATMIFGPTYRLSESTTIRAALWHDVNPAGHSTDTQAFIQLYYYGN